MKKLLILIFILLTMFSFNKRKEVNAEESINLNGSKALVMEVTTGKILYSSNEHEKAYPASMTKIMSLILIMENIESGKLKWNDIVVASKNASSMGGSQIYLETNATLTQNLLEIKNYIDIISADIKLETATGLNTYDKHETFLKNCNNIETFAKIVFDEKITTEEISRCCDIGKTTGILLLMASLI